MSEEKKSILIDRLQTYMRDIMDTKKVKTYLAYLEEQRKILGLDEDATIMDGETNEMP